MLVKDIMKTKVTTLNTNARLGFAEEIMYLGRIRHLPVVKGSFLVGIITQRDLFRASLTSIITNWKENKNFLDSIEVEEIMVKDVVTVPPDYTVENAAQLLIDKKIGCLPVVENDMELIGLVTETDVLQYYISQAKQST